MTIVKDKTKFVTVTNISNGKKLSYLMPPKKAVLYAWFQYEMNDWSWWDYDKRERPLVMVNKHTYSCGDWFVKRR